MPGVRVGRHARIRRAIIDRDVLDSAGAVIGYDPEEDRRRHTVSDGGVVVVTVGRRAAHRAESGNMRWWRKAKRTARDSS